MGAQGGRKGFMLEAKTVNSQSDAVWVSSGDILHVCVMWKMSDVLHDTYVINWDLAI